MAKKNNTIISCFISLFLIFTFGCHIDVIKSFVEANNGLEVANKSISENNKVILRSLLIAKYNEPKQKPFYEKAKEVDSISDRLVDYIECLKARICAYSEESIPKAKELSHQISKEGIGKEIHNSDYYFQDPNIKKYQKFNIDKLQSKEDYKKPTEILIGNSNDGLLCEAHILKEKLLDYNKYIKQLSIGFDGNKNSIDLGKDLKEIRVGEIDPKKLKDKSGKPNEEYSTNEGKWVTWEIYNFYHTITVADIVILNKIIIDIKNAQNQILKKIDSCKIETD